MRRLLFALALLLCASPALALDWSNAYTVNADTNPTTKSFQTNAGQYVDNTATSYVNWVGRCGNPNINAVRATATADNGSGAVRLTVDDSGAWVTGDYVVTTGVSSDANGTRAVTIINQTQVDLVGSTYTGAAVTTGCFGAGFKFTTEAAMYAGLNIYNTSITRPLFQDYGAGNTADVTLTLPLAYVIRVGFSDNSHSVIMPAANLPGSPPMGQPTFIQSAGNGFLIKTPPPSSSSFGFVTQADVAMVYIGSNNTPDIAWLNNISITRAIGVATPSGAILMGDGSQWNAFPVLGDCTLLPTGDFQHATILCSKTNGAAFGALATLGIGTGLSSSGGNLNVNPGTITGLLPLNNGGCNTSLPNTAGLLYLNGRNCVVNVPPPYAAISVWYNGKPSFAAAPCGSAMNFNCLASLSAQDQTLSGGANVVSYSPGTISGGTLTMDCGRSPLQYYTNGGAHTLAAPTLDGSCIIMSTNNASAGTITFSGFTVGSNVGDALTTTNTSKFKIHIDRINAISSYSIQALQ